MPRISPAAAPVLRLPVRRLVLTDFRSYAALDLELGHHLVVLNGLNGAGKTNILEALSFLSLGRGLRRAELRECARSTGAGGWAVSVELAADEDLVQLGTGFEFGEAGTTSRKCRINRAAATSAAAFAEHVRVIWLTPAMDGLFAGSAGERRRFLDRLVLAVDAAHGARVNALERALRNRNRLLEDQFADKVWLEATEREVAELGIAVANARHETLSRLQTLILQERDDNLPFPWAEVTLSGEIDRLIAAHPSVIAEEKYREILRNGRARDAAAGRTLFGPHVSDLAVRHGPKDMEAAQSSTGEQKALLTGLVLAHARLVAQMSGIAPLILLDEIAAHFDVARREALFETLETLGAQVWLTGADASAFAVLKGRAQLLVVQDGKIAG